jgi:hypothetical protein
MTDIEDYRSGSVLEQIAATAGRHVERMYQSAKPGAYFFTTATQHMPRYIKDEKRWTDSVLDWYLDSEKYYVSRHGDLQSDVIETLALRDAFEYMQFVQRGYVKPFAVRKMNDRGF